MTGPDLEAAERRVIDTIGALMEFWGFKAMLGRIWAILYMSSDPRSAAEIGERLSLSAGSVSMALGELLKWGVVKKAWRQGERRDYFEAETSVWKMVSRVFRERELVFVRDAIEAFDAALKLIDKAKPRASVPEKRRLKFAEARLKALLSLSRMGESLLSMLVSGEAVDPQPLKQLFDRDRA
jgi:DNA-binding transcriptional regulator GbsR (MarR family)